MPTIRIGSRDLLEYDARYGILICRKCQYAIQKSALRSHLLRHKIYRDERQRLMSSIAQLELLEPHHVPLPTPASPPIDALPIISGYRCMSAGCGNLCASSKRMRRHRIEVHGLSEPTNSCSFARPVKLQTFFRGTKLKYFEVNSLLAADTTRAAPLATTTTDNDGDDGIDEEEHYEQVHDADTAVPLPPSTRRMLTPPKTSPVDLDLEMLTYFHHFITTTSVTLPSAKGPESATQYWQTNVVLQALQRRWLMCGLLAISACHLASLADDATVVRVHREQSTQFFSELLAGLEETIQPDISPAAAGVEVEAKKAGWQMRCMLRCAHCALAGSMLDQGIILQPAAFSQLQSIMMTVRDFVIPDNSLRPHGVRKDDSNLQEGTFAQARRILRIGSSSNAESFDRLSSSNNIPSALLIQLRELPSRMAETFGKPNDARNVLVTLSAIASLVKCCDTSFASDEAGAAWWGMALWLTKVPDHFNIMVSRNSPAALVVLAHWATSLVKRAEICGCWFSRGLANTILQQITELLPADDHAVQSLVGNLMASTMNSMAVATL